MRANDRLRPALAELGIVVVGFMIALAADSWREGWLEARVEARYLEQLRDDVSAGLSALNIERETYRAVVEATRVLTTGLEGNSHPVDDRSLLDKLIVATQTGFDREEMASDVTYRELLESGQLNLIQDDHVRERIVAYFRNSERLISGLVTLPKVNDRFAALTGYYPIQVAQHEVKLTSNDENRLLASLRHGPEWSNQLRLLHAQAHFTDQLFEDLIAQGQNLLTTLE